MPTSITVAPCLPTDIPGGAPNATLSAAGVFAWQELLALSWPSVNETGGANTRGEADPSKRLEAGQDESSSQLPTWATFRHKSEVFPGDGSRPHGTYGAGAYYDDLPRYIYDPTRVGSGYVQDGVTLATGQIPRCDDTSPYDMPEGETFVTADESSQIGQDFMFAGKNEQQQLGSNGGDAASRSQILFLVKVNRKYFDYIVSSKHIGAWWQGIPPDVRQNTLDYLAKHTEDPPPDSSDMVSFRNGTMMVKSAWRRATNDDRSSGRYLIKKVRYYEHQDPSKTYGKKPGNKDFFCYSTNYYALVGIHILQKTPSAPYFIYASFEQADNLLTADGHPIEDENGAVVIANQAPLNPAVSSVNATATKGQLLSPKLAGCPPGSSLYYQNNPQLAAVTQGKVCVRGRKHAIPSEIIDVNRQAHALLDAYAAPPPATQCTDEGLPCTSNFQCCSGYCIKQGFTSGCTGGTHHLPAPPVSRLKYYKLVNVQTAPFDKTPGVDYQKVSSGPDPSTYYMANIVVETNYPLQVFSGTFGKNDAGKADGTITDFVNGAPFKNTQYSGHAYNMGGCMGCHGVAQSRGGGFSFAFEGIRGADGKSEGFNTAPEVAEGVSSEKSFVQRYQNLLRNDAQK